MSGILATISTVASVAAGWSPADQHVALDRVVEVAQLLGRQVVEGGRHVAARARRPARWRPPSPGAARAAGTRGRRGQRVGHRDDDLARQLAASTDVAVCAAPSHGVAITTTSASTAPSLSPASIGRSRSGHCVAELVDGPPWPGTSTASRSRPRTRPRPAARPASVPAGPVPPRIPMRIGRTVVARLDL